MWENKFFDGYVSFESADRTDEWLRQDNRDSCAIPITLMFGTNDNTLQGEPAGLRPRMGRLIVVLFLQSLLGLFNDKVVRGNT